MAGTNDNIMKTVKNVLGILFFLSISMVSISSCDSADSDLDPTLELNENMNEGGGTQGYEGDDGGIIPPSVE